MAGQGTYSHFTTHTEQTDCSSYTSICHSIDPAHRPWFLECLSNIIMYSGSNTYLGGAGQNGRPGVPQQFNSFQQPQQQQPQQQNFLNANPTGYGAPAPLQQNFTGYPMQQQATGFPAQQMQPQQTGFQGQPSPFNAQPPQQQAFQTGAPPMPQIPSQFQNQNQSQPPASAPMQQPQPTGFAQMADSFKSSSGVAPGRGRRADKPKSKIPSIRLSFITATDQAKFEQLFKSAVGEGTTLSGDKSRDLLMRSRLDGDSLSQIWYVYDTLGLRYLAHRKSGPSQIPLDPVSFCSRNLHLLCISAISSSPTSLYLLFSRKT